MDKILHLLAEGKGSTTAIRNATTFFIVVGDLDNLLYQIPFAKEDASLDDDTLHDDPPG